MHRVSDLSLSLRWLLKTTYLLLTLLFNGVTWAGLNEPMGDLNESHLTAHGISLLAENGRMELSVYSPTVVRVRVAPGPLADDFSFAVIQKPEGRFSSANEDAARIKLSTGELTVVIDKHPLRLNFLDKNGKVLSEENKEYGVSHLGSEITCYRQLFPDERFLGLGEKTGPLDRRGSAYENWNSDVPQYRLDQDPLYDSIPFFIGLHDHLAYGIFLDNSYRTRFNFGASTDEKMSSFTVPDGELNYYFIGSDSVEKVIGDYTWLTGHAKLPPLWSFGYQQCRWSYYPDKEVLRIARTFREKHIPADVIYLDIDYMDHCKVFTFDPEKFPQPDMMVSELKEMGFHVVVIVDPGVKVEPGYFAYDAGVKNHYFAQYPDGEDYVGNVWPGRASFPDFTKASVRDWWGTLFANYTSKGIEGFWNDMNEPSTWGQSIPDMVQFDLEGHPTTIRQAHNVFGMQMSRATYDGARKSMNGRRPLVVTRATYSGGQRYSTIWTGDNFASDDHMLLGVRLVNSLGLSGFPFTGPDEGGFFGAPSKELAARWLSVGVYTPFFRNHAERITPSREPWVYGRDIEEISRELINQRYRLLPYIYSAAYEATQDGLPYIYSAAYEATQDGLPLARSLAINYSFDPNIYSADYQNEYLFGPNLLIAPVISTQQFGRVYLPEGQWYRLSGDERYAGGRSAVVAAPLNDLPVFAKAGAIIPMQSVTQSSSEKGDGILYLHVYAGSTNSLFTYYEDDGLTFQFEQGDFYRRLISYDPQNKQIELGAKEGRYKSKFNRVKLMLHGFDPVDKVVLNGATVSVAKESDTIQSAEFSLKDSQMVMAW